MWAKRLVTISLLLGVVLGFGAGGVRAADILFISSMDATHMPGDDALKAFMEGMGHTVTYLDDNETEAVTEAAAAAADLVFISESVGSGNIRNEITEIATPMIIPECWAWDEMGLTLGGGAGQEVVSTDIEIVAPGHPLAAGLTESVPVLTALSSTRGAARFGNGIAGPEATVIARAALLDGVTYDVIFIYEKGAALPVAPTDGSPQVAAEMRICLGFDEQSYLAWNENAYALLRAAINYGLGVRPQRGSAFQPYPAAGAVDVLRDTVLSWTPGDFADTHDVYFGTVFNDVSNAGRADPLGVLVSQGQDANTYDPAGLLEFGQTYYWRIDEVNAAPDATIYTGDVWSFNAEPLAYPVIAITATASSFKTEDLGPRKTIDGSGLDDEDRHSAAETDMWLSSSAGETTWIQYEFDRPYKLYEMWVWNYNSVFEPILGFGIKDVTVEYSLDGADWIVLEEVQFARGNGQGGYSPNTIFDLGGVVARFIRLTPKSNWGGMVAQYGLSEVRFFFVAAQAREPAPAAGQTDVGIDAVLSWRAGNEAASHQVHFGTDRQAVIDGTAPVVTLGQSAFDPGLLQFGTAYFWKVTEVNEAETPAAWEGDLWSFSTKEYSAVDDFESYNDDIDAGTTIYQAWIDGWTNDTGSTVGYINAPFAERTIVHGGKQSMPLDYNNIDSPFYSEAEREFDPVQNWSVSNADTLVLHLRGNPVRFLESSPGTITMSGGGTDIWNTVDQFRFAFKRLSGNGVVVARVESIDDIDPWTKAGVMIRETLDPGSRFAAVYATPGQGVRFQARLLNTGAATSDTTVATPAQMALTTPVWIKLERSGGTFSGFYSTNGTTWTAMSWNPQTINMAASVYVGLALTSHSAGAMATAQFSNVSMTGATSSWEVAEIGVAQPSNDPAPLYVVVEDSAGRVKVVQHPDPAATTVAAWQPWRIPLAQISGAGVNLKAVKKMYIGVGDRASPAKGGAGLLYIDDIGVGHPAQ